MTYGGPDAGIIKQWESKVRRWISQGRTREQILFDMTAANWTYADAEQFVRTSVGREKRKWILASVICGLLAMWAVAATVLSIMYPTPRGGNFFLPIGTTVGFIYGLVRLVKIKA